VAREPVGCRLGNERSLGRVTTIAMGTGIDDIVESEDLAASHEGAPTVVALLD
jgi:tartronate-semialdehyde synthase